MKNCLKLGDKVKTLVDKIENDNVFGEQKCAKGTIGRICDIGEDYVLIEANNQHNEIEVFSFGFNEVELIK